MDRLQRAILRFFFPLPLLIGIFVATNTRIRNFASLQLSSWDTCESSILLLNKELKEIFLQNPSVPDRVLNATRNISNWIAYETVQLLRNTVPSSILIIVVSSLITESRLYFIRRAETENIFVFARKRCRRTAKDRFLELWNLTNHRALWQLKK